MVSILFKSTYFVSLLPDISFLRNRNASSPCFSLLIAHYFTLHPLLLPFQFPPTFPLFFSLLLEPSSSQPLSKFHCSSVERDSQRSLGSEEGNPREESNVGTGKKKGGGGRDLRTERGEGNLPLTFSTFVSVPMRRQTGENVLETNPFRPSEHLWPLTGRFLDIRRPLCETSAQHEDHLRTTYHSDPWRSRGWFMKSTCNYSVLREHIWIHEQILYIISLLRVKNLI